MWTWCCDVAGPCRPSLLYFRSVASLAGLLNAETSAAAVLRVCSFPFFPSRPPQRRADRFYDGGAFSAVSDTGDLPADEAGICGIARG